MRIFSITGYYKKLNIVSCSMIVAPYLFTYFMYSSVYLPFHFSLSCIGVGNGNPLQYSCLENPWDGGAWWASAYGVSQSRTRLKRLSSSSVYLLSPNS